MTDRELLEWAAKAAGIELWHEDVFTDGLTKKVSANGVIRWNPLTDGGDTLWLAITLRTRHSQMVEVLIDSTTTSVVIRGKAFCREKHGDDPQAATRRAIVRAAAEIGKSMEKQK